MKGCVCFAGNQYLCAMTRAHLIMSVDVLMPLRIDRYKNKLDDWYLNVLVLNICMLDNWCE